MITIHIDFVDGVEVSYKEGLDMLEKDPSVDFTTNVLTFFTQNGFTAYPCDNVVIVDKHGRCIDRNELLTNTGHKYTDKFIRPAHNIYKMLVANSFTWKQPGDSHQVIDTARFNKSDKVLYDLSNVISRPDINPDTVFEIMDVKHNLPYIERYEIMSLTHDENKPPFVRSNVPRHFLTAVDKDNPNQ